ncbi:tyrosine-type recombinase/integrase [Streptomyces sp. NPDC002734]
MVREGRVIGSITSQDIAEWRAGQEAAGLAPATVHRHYVVLKAAFIYAHEMEIIPRNPTLATKRRGRAPSLIKPVRGRDIPSTKEVQDIFEAMWGPLKASVWLMAGTGARPGEALAVSRSSLEAPDGLLKLWQQVTSFSGNETKGRATGFKNELKWSREPRFVPYSYTVQLAVERHMAEFGTWGEHGWLFESPKCKNQPFSLKGYDTRWKRALRDAGLEHTGCTPKSLRHYFASVCIAGGVPVFEVAKWLGHKGTRVTEATYVHLLADAHLRSTDAIELAIVENAQHAQEARWS